MIWHQAVSNQLDITKVVLVLVGHPFEGETFQGEGDFLSFAVGWRRKVGL